MSAEDAIVQGGEREHTRCRACGGTGEAGFTPAQGQLRGGPKCALCRGTGLATSSSSPDEIPSAPWFDCLTTEQNGEIVAAFNKAIAAARAWPVASLKGEAVEPVAWVRIFPKPRKGDDPFAHGLGGHQACVWKMYRGGKDYGGVFLLDGLDITEQRVRDDAIATALEQMVRTCEAIDKA